MKNLKLTVIHYPQAAGGYTTVCPELGLTTQGETFEEAEAALKELVDDYFEHDESMEADDYIEGFNTGYKIITELDYEFTAAN